MIPFDQNAINEYLGILLTLEEGEIDAFSKCMQRGNWNIGRISQSLLARGTTVMKNAYGIPIKFKKEDMTIRAQVSLTLMLYIIRPQNHTFIVSFESSYLLYYLVEGSVVDVAKVIANEIKTITDSGTKQGSKPNCPLAFPGLIMGLCKKHKIHIPKQVHKVITSVVDEIYISSYCNPKPDGTQEEDKEDEDVTLSSNIGFQDWVRTSITHSWDQNHLTIGPYHMYKNPCIFSNCRMVDHRKVSLNSSTLKPSNYTCHGLGTDQPFRREQVQQKKNTNNQVNLRKVMKKKEKKKLLKEEVMKKKLKEEVVKTMMTWRMTESSRKI